MMRSSMVTLLGLCAVGGCSSSSSGLAGTPDAGSGDARGDDSGTVVVHDGGKTGGHDGGTGGQDSGGTSGQDSGGTGGQDSGSPGNDASTGGNLTMYSDGVIDETKWPASDDYSFGGADNYKDTTHPESGHTYALSLTGTGMYAGWQQASNWALPYQGGTNGVDLSPYTQLEIDVYLSSDNDLNGISAHYTRSTGDDVGTCTSLTDVQALLGPLSAGSWHTHLKVPLAFLGMLSSYNTYKFSIQQKNGPTYFDNVQFVKGNTGWIYAGSGKLESGWADASTTLTADYAWVPQSLNPGGAINPSSNTGLFAINNPPLAAELTGALSGTTLTVTNVTAGAIAVGQYVFGSNVAASTTIVSGAGATWTVSPSSGAVSAEPMTSGLTQAQVDGVSLSASGTWRANDSAGFSLSQYESFTFGALPTASGYAYTVQLYNASGAAVGNAVDASTYTPNDFGAQNASFTVYSIPLSAFGSVGSSIGGVSIAVNQKTYLSAIGFWK